METIAIDYSRHYQNWHSNSPGHVEKMVNLYKKTVISYFPGDKNSKILDIGCGMGFLLIALQREGYTDLSGIDMDASQVKACLENGINARLEEDTIGFLLKNEEQYDVITAFDLLEHIPVDVQVLFSKAVLKALKPGGLFLLTVPNATSVLGTRNRYIDYTHHVLFTEVSLDFVLYNAGFDSIEIKALDYVTYSFSLKSLFHRLLLGYFRLHRRLEMIAELGTTWGKKVPLSFNLIGKAKKRTT